MTRMEEIGRKQGELSDKIDKVRGDLAAATQREKDLEQAYERAVHQCFAGEIPQKQEDVARAAWDAVKIEVDRLKRILPMLEAQVGPLEQQQEAEHRAACLRTAAQTENTLEELGKKICDKYEEIVTLGRQMEAIEEDAWPFMNHIGRPRLRVAWFVQEEWKKRQARVSPPLSVIPCER